MKRKIRIEIIEYTDPKSETKYDFYIKINMFFGSSVHIIENIASKYNGKRYYVKELSSGLFFIFVGKDEDEAHNNLLLFTLALDRLYGCEPHVIKLKKYTNYEPRKHKPQKRSNLCITYPNVNNINLNNIR